MHRSCEDLTLPWQLGLVGGGWSWAEAVPPPLTFPEFLASREPHSLLYQVLPRGCTEAGSVPKRPGQKPELLRRETRVGSWLGVWGGCICKGRGLTAPLPYLGASPTSTSYGASPTWRSWPAGGTKSPATGRGPGILPCYVTLGKSLSSWGLSFPICKMSSLKWMVSKDPKSGILRFLFPPCGG